VALTKPEVAPIKGEAPADLVITDLVVGDGEEAKTGDTVTVHYVGVTRSSKIEFDASWTRQQPFQFTLGEGQVIPGWDKGVAGMKRGGRRLEIPSHLGYGPRGVGGVIRPDKTLIFVVDLLMVN
jgi:peptidylprolyl isomerase